MARIFQRPLTTGLIEVVEQTGKRGDIYDAVLPVACRAVDYVGVTLYVKGQITVTRLGGTANHGGRPHVWNEEEFSTERNLPKVISPGAFRFEVTSDSALHYCVRRTDGKAMKFDMLRVPKGSTIALAKGQRLFIALGTVAKKDKVTFVAPRLLTASIADTELDVLDNVFGLRVHDAV